MSPEHDDYLATTYRAMLPRDPRSCMVLFGCECEDGWFTIIDTALRRLQAYRCVRIDQIKEKFGELRIYSSGHADDYQAIQAVIHDAEVAAAHTCELCGADGTLAIAGLWLKTLCDTHCTEHHYRRLIPDDSDVLGGV